MIPLSDDLDDLNGTIAKSADLLDLVAHPKLGSMLEGLCYDWSTGSFDARSPMVPLMERHGFIIDGDLTRLGVLFLSRLLIHFGADDEGYGSLEEKYCKFELMSVGKNSIVLRAAHGLLGYPVVLKVVRPGASSDIASSIRLLGNLNLDSAVVLPQDLLRVAAKDVLGRDVTLDCLVFPYVDGLTLRTFLQQGNHHLNSQIAIAFARQVGGALGELEELGAYHGDLHAGNILVDQSLSAGLRFRLVDISFGAMGSIAPGICRNNDLDAFKQHLWRILSAQRAQMPDISIRKYVGTRSYRRLMAILAPGVRTFREVNRILSEDAEYTKFTIERARFVEERFDTPVSFRLQRYEEISDPSVAVELFVPFQQLMTRIRDFGNIYVSGNRGSGKSTYLASLAFFPNARSSIVEYRDTFGIYFPCRQGEFRSLASRETWDGDLERRLTSSVLAVKIVRRTLEVVASGLASGELREPTDLAPLRRLVAEFVPAPGIVSVDTDIQSEVDNLVSTMVRIEMDHVTQLATETQPVHEPDPALLIRFFGLVRSSFPDLAATRFHLLFDDAGSPYMPRNVQRALNDLMLTSNHLFCVKISAEKLTFDFTSSQGKALEVGQDYLEHDISQILFIGSTGSGGLARKELERYFREIVEQRLAHFHYRSRSITDYLGDSQLSVERLQELLSLQARGAYYAGWTTVWNIADRTPRNLLEIVSEIFVVSGITRDGEPRVAPMRAQDRAIRTISEKRLESLSQISGTVQVDGQIVSLGRRLFETTSALGSTFRKYLRAEADKRRKRQYLAIERNDFGELSQDAETILRRLITFGVLDAGKSGFARDDVIKKPFYVLNRIYCPAFQIGYQRDAHLRLSRGKLEMLLLEPTDFARQGTSRLRGGDVREPDLFDYRRS